MLVLLVRPDRPDVESERKRVGLRHQPLGLLYLATAAHGAGFDVEIVDEVLGENAERRIEQLRPDWVGITVASRLFRRSCEIARFAKARGARVVLGGPHPTALPEHSLVESGADVVVIGEGEQTFVELLTTCQWDRVRGLCFNRDGRVVKTESRPPIEDLDRLPIPNRQLLRLQRYRSDSELGHYVPRGDRLIRLMATRGCPYRCTFCAGHAVFGRRVRFRSTESVVEEIRQCVADFDAHHFSFIDDTLTVQPDYATELCERLIRSRLRVRWSCLSRVGLDDRMLGLMRRAGCVMLGFGIESGSRTVLEWIRKEIDPAVAMDTIRRARRHGLVTKTFWIVGLPKEGEREYRESLLLAKRLGSDFAIPSVFLPLPGSEEFDRMQRAGLETDPNRIISVSSDEGESRRRQRRFLREFYLRPAYLYSVLRHLCGASIRQHLALLWAFLKEGAGLG